MGILEKKAQLKLDRELKSNQRVWTANSGMAYQGRFVSIKGKKHLTDLRVFKGMDEGFPDNVGFDSIVITPEMIGKTVAVFVGSEIKASKGEKLRKKQVNFKNMVVKMGGIFREHRPDRVIESGFLTESVTDC